jgi:tRNA threonylcarbamoyladenosine biosynthesis protein TsaE
LTAAAGAASPAPGLDEQVVVATAAEMRSLGARIARLLEAGDVVVLSGPLGAGKTTLAQGIGAGLDVRGHVTSPTFVIARVHPSLRGGPDLVHADAYRLGSRAEVDDLDLDADLATAVTVVEWGEGLVEDLAASFLAVHIRAHGEMTTSAGTGLADAGAADIDVPRTLQVRGFGDRWREPAAAIAMHGALSGRADDQI